MISRLVLSSSVIIIILNPQRNISHIYNDTSENEKLGNNGNCEVKNRISEASLIISGNFNLFTTLYVLFHKCPYAT
jgi:hypothetical protein